MSNLVFLEKERPFVKAGTAPLYLLPCFQVLLFF